MNKILSLTVIATAALVLQPVDVFAWGGCRGGGGSFSHSGSTSFSRGSGFSHSGSTSHSYSGGGYHYGGYGGAHYGGCYGGGFAAGAVTGAAVTGAAAAATAAYYNQYPTGVYYRPAY